MAVSIDVVSISRRGSIKPVKFKYAGRTHRVQKILYNWMTREGGFPVHHFSVSTLDDNLFEISLNTYTMNWLLEETALETG